MSALLAQKFDQIPHPFLVVCEGYGDARFICSLLKHKNITNCNVGCPSDTGGHGSGISAIAKYLESVRGVIQAGRGSLNGVAVVVDSDLNANDGFKTICEALEAAQFQKPSKAFSIEEKNSFRSGIFVIPGKGKTGTLEHLLWEAVIEKNPSIENCAGTFCQCVGGHIDAATENQKAKMKLSSTLGAHCKSNPWTSLGLVWKQPENPIPIESKKFLEIADFLLKFTT
jgi:hypothetical protein